jgi:hypothetical protein
VSLIGGCSGNLGVLLSLRCVLVALHVVVLAMMVCGGAMRLGWALSIVFAASAFVVFNELNWLSGQLIGA